MSRELATEARKEAILQAALTLFTNHGYAATTIEDIRWASGASVGSIYHHFGNKQDVAEQLYESLLRDYQEGVLELISGAPAAREGVEGMVRHHLGWVANHPTEARYLLSMRPRASGRLRTMNRRFFKEVFGWLAEQAEAGRIRKVRRNLYFPLVIGPSQELSRQWLDGLVEEPLEDAADVLAEAAWNAVRTGGRR
jgi:AcrR family transcriptional regulator